MAMSSAEESYRKTEALVNEVEVIKEDYDKFVDALLESYNPTKKHNYYGMKTKKFIIKKYIENLQ